MEKTQEQIAIEKQRTRLTKFFHEACAGYQLIEEGDHILIGLSGGKDSLLLTELLGKRAQIYKPRFRVTALHVRVKERDYHSDLSYLEDFCRQAGVPLVVRDISLPPTPPLREGRTPREIDNPCFLCAWYRRKELFNVAQEIGCNKIAFGHHKDDIIETLLMNQIFQGAYATMPPVLQMEKMPLQIIRPLALIEEADLIRYAEMRRYEKQKQLCPFEHVSSRAKVKDLVEQIKALNPEAMDSMYAAMMNIKKEYLPQI